jgi:Trk K+ transport system NAD-binding subunit
MKKIIDRKEAALLFGYNEYSLEIKRSIAFKYENIELFSLEDNPESSKFDLSDDWGELEEKFDMDNSIAFCVLKDDAKNIFLTLSLRASFKNLKIIAFCKNKEGATKLSLAGADKVIPLIQTTANMISDMLRKPIVTKVMHGILYEQSDLKIAQILVEKDASFVGKHPFEVDWGEEFGIIVLSIMQDDVDSSFIYSSKAKHKEIKTGDILIVVGYDKEIIEFESLIGSRCEVNWSDWSR